MTVDNSDNGGKHDFEFPNCQLSAATDFAKIITLSGTTIIFDIFSK